MAAAAAGGGCLPGGWEREERGKPNLIP